EIVSLAEDETVSSALIVCVNRLSDLLFAMARRANHAAGVADVVWVGRGE
ncbi:MAG: ATP:cob(I)alamin adenosyltransferase, partial [Phycisphaerales bacterium]|nr:ATP:cob(I)alamin adenosyltransferase [Phycisphaerales bacterium]